MRRLPTRPPSAWWSPPMTGPPRPSRPRPRLGVAVVAALLALGAAGCGDDAASPSSPTSTTTSTTTTTTMASPDTAAATPAAVGDEAEVRATIDRYWEAFLAATSEADPNNPELSSVLSGEARLRILGSIEAMEQNGQRVVAPEGSVFMHETTSVVFDAPDRATVTECVVDDLQIVESVTGSVVDGAITTSEYTTTLFGDGEWRITSREQTRREIGVLPCAEVAP